MGGFRFTQSAVIKRTPADVWQVLIDFPNVPRWERGPVAVRQESPGTARRNLARLKSMMEGSI